MKIIYNVYEVCMGISSIYDRLLIVEEFFKTEAEAENYIKENAYKNRSYTIMKVYQK